MAVELAVADGPMLPRLARLVTLVGLVPVFSSYCIGLGIEMVFAVVDIPSLITVPETGVSCSLLIPAPLPAISVDRTLCPGFSLVGLLWLVWLSSLNRRSSDNAAAPVSGVEENPGEKVPFNRGGFGDGDAPNPAFAIEVKFAGLCIFSGRLRLRDLVRVESDSGKSIGDVVGMVAESDKFAVKTGVVADTAACSDAMR